MLEQGVGRFERRLGDQAHQVVDAQVAVDGLVVASHALGGHAPPAGMRIEHHRVARGNHAHRVAGDRGQRMRHRRNGADHAERGVLDDRQAVIAAEDFAPQELDARRPLAERLELLDLVRQPADLRLFHLHRAQLDALVDGDAADVGDDAPAVFQRAAREPLEGFARGRHGLVDVGEQAEAALVAAGHRALPLPLPPSRRQHLFHHASDQGFVNVHDRIPRMPLSACAAKQSLRSESRHLLIPNP